MLPRLIYLVRAMTSHAQQDGRQAAPEMNQQHHRRGAGHALAALKMIEHGPVVADDHEQRRHDASHPLDAEGGRHQQIADQAGEGGFGKIAHKGNQADLQAQIPSTLLAPVLWLPSLRIFTPSRRDTMVPVEIHPSR